MTSRTPLVLAVLASSLVAFASTLQASPPEEDSEKARAKILRLENELLEERSKNDRLRKKASDRYEALHRRFFAADKAHRLTRSQLETAQLDAEFSLRLKRLRDRVRPRVELLNFESQGSLAEALSTFSELTGHEARLVGIKGDSHQVTLRTKGWPSSLAGSIADNVHSPQDKSWLGVEVRTVYEFRLRSAEDR